MFFRYLLQIERHLRSLMSYYFSEQYGESQSAYLDANNFNNSRRNHNTVSRLIATLQRAASTTDYVYINYYRNTYGNIPLWVLINVLTFGNLSKMYKVFPQSLQSKVCKNFGIINQRQMEQFLSVLTKFRNVCAHGERLFTYQTIDNISDLPLHRKMSIPMNGIQYQYGKNDLFAVVIAFRYLIPNKDFLVFKRKLAALIDHTSKKTCPYRQRRTPEQNGVSTQLEEYSPLPFNIIKAKKGRCRHQKANIFLFFIFFYAPYPLPYSFVSQSSHCALLFLSASNAADLTRKCADQSFLVLMADYSFFHQSCYNSVLPLSLHFADTLRSHKTSASFQEVAFPVFVALL